MHQSMRVLIHIVVICLVAVVAMAWNPDGCPASFVATNQESNYDGDPLQCMISFMAPGPHDPSWSPDEFYHWSGVTQWYDQECGVAALQFDGKSPAEMVHRFIADLRHWKTPYCEVYKGKQRDECWKRRREAGATEVYFPNWFIASSAIELETPKGRKWTCPAGHACGYVIDMKRWAVCGKGKEVEEDPATRERVPIALEGIELHGDFQIHGETEHLIVQTPHRTGPGNWYRIDEVVRNVNKEGS